MRRTRRTDSPDTVKFIVQFLKSALPVGSYDAHSVSTNNLPALLLKATQLVLE